MTAAETGAHLRLSCSHLGGEAEDGPRLTVDLDALAANHAVLKQAAAGAEVAPVVKADAYGLGMGPVALRLWREGARRFFVARAIEGVTLKAVLGPQRPAAIYVLDGCTPASAGELAAHGLVPVLNTLAQVASWQAEAHRRGHTLAAAVQIDTGLNRLGFGEAEARALAQSRDRLRGLEVELVMSHLACADEADHLMNTRQAALFETLAAQFPTAATSLAATSGTFLGPSIHGDIVRPGIGLYGAGGPPGLLTPVATLDAPILQVRSIGAGESVGYGAGFTARRPMQVAILACGYADGVLRAQSGRGYCWFAGERRALLGRISMDLIALDVTGCEAQPGARAELFGPNRLLDDVAVEAGTIGYELLTRIAPRVPRVYLGGEPRR